MKNRMRRSTRLWMHCLGKTKSRKRRNLYAGERSPAGKRKLHLILTLKERGEMPRKLYTLTGPVEIDSLGLILPHEHLFTDLRGPSVSGYAQGDPDAVVRVV